MNYTIKAVSSDVVIGAQTFTQTATDLTECSCLTTEFFNPLFTAVQNGELQVLKKGQIVSNQVAIISKVITKFQSEENEEDLLNEDYLESKRFLRANITNLETKAIDELYTARIKDGEAYYRKKRAETVKAISQGDITEADAFLIDTKTQQVKSSILSGDWKTALGYLNLTVVEGAYTQTVKDSFVSEITDYIVNAY